MLPENELTQPAEDLVARIAELANAIHTRQLTVHYQPVVDLHTGRTLAVEALVRWQHPERGLVPPIEFISLAEDSGLISPLTQAVVDQVAEQLDVWRASGHELECAINISAHALTEAKSSEVLVQSLMRLAGRVTIEVTESVMVNEAAVAQIARLAAAGIPSAIDDFGTGYSSIGALKALPVGTLKIDRSLIKDIEADLRDFEVARGVVALAHSFGLNVIAEGIETEGAALRLLEAGVVQGQGFWFARPMPGELLTQWLNTVPRHAPSPVALAQHQLVDAHGVCAHGVVLYESDAELVGEVAKHISEALVHGDRAMVIATAQHRVALLERLAPELRVLAEQCGLLNIMDAQETLALIMRDGVPDAGLFDLHVGAVVRAGLKDQPGLRAYGEMVALLWRDGNVIGALQLEDLWNDLQRECSFSLLCAYPLADAVGTSSAGLAQICLTHSAVQIGQPTSPVLEAASPQNMQVLLEATRSLLRINSVGEAVGVLQNAISALGGEAVTLDASMAEAIPLALELGRPSSLIPIVEVGPQAWVHLESLLPQLVEDAKIAAAKVARLAVLADEASTDPLTGLANRRTLDRLGDLNCEDCVAILDLDHFRRINDRYGHQAGDRLLIAFSHALNDHLRSTDLAFRVGGEEFIVVMPSTPMEGAAAALEHLRRMWKEERPMQVSFSAGVARMAEASFNEALVAADLALYRAKQSGRDRVLCATERDLLIREAVS